MTEKPENPDTASGEASEISFNEGPCTPAEEYKVGPGSPPLHTRWKKGGSSPNPGGRPRKDASMLPDVRSAFERALNKKVPVPRGDRKVLMTRVEIGFEQLLNQFAKGDRYARRDLMEYAGKLDVDLLAKHKSAIEETLAPKEQEILDSYVKRHSDTKNLAPADRVLAPPELHDDDEPAKSETDFQLPPEPQAKLKFPEPTPIPGKTYPKPFSQMTPLQKQIYYREWWEKYGEAWEKQRAEEQKAAPKLDQASLGRGRPPPGGVSLTTGKWT